MSKMENLSAQLDEKERQNMIYAAAVKQIEAEKLSRRVGGHAVMAAAIGYGEGALGSGTFGKVSHFAKLFCIGFAFLAPSLLLLRVAF